MEQNRNLLIYIIAVIFLATSLAFITVSFGLLKNPFGASPTEAKQAREEVVNTTPLPNIPAESTTSATRESSPSATPTPEVTKSDLKIQILNGSGITGQAGKLKSSLEDIGYDNISTGNITSSNSKQTSVVFDSSVPQTVQDEIVSTLKKTFDSVKSSITKNAKYDISITTGSYSTPS